MVVVIDHADFFHQIPRSNVFVIDPVAHLVHLFLRRLYLKSSTN